MMASGFNIWLVFVVCGFCMHADQSYVVTISASYGIKMSLIWCMYSFQLPSDINSAMDIIYERLEKDL